MEAAGQHSASKRMKAAVYSRYGPPDVLEIRDVEKPVPKDDEVLIKVCAASMNPADWRLVRGIPFVLRMLFRLRKPSTTRPGQAGVDVAGQVEAVGRAVQQFKLGDEVFGASRGAFAEYACTSESRLAVKPEGVTFEQAAAVPVAGLTALQALRDKAHIRPGQKVLINGAAGGVGTFAVQIAKWLGADVTGVCSTRNVGMVRSLGADRVIDYTQEDFTRDAQRYDVILDNIGNHSLSACRRVLNPNGIFVLAGGPKKGQTILLRGLKALMLSWFVSQKMFLFIAKINSADLTTLGELITAGKVRSIIDRHYSLSEVAQAMRYVEDGHARAKVIIHLE